MMRKTISATLLAGFLAAATAFAADHEREGRIVRIDPDAHVMVVQSKGGDQWELSWTETTKFEDGLVATQLRPGDKIEFEYVERDNRKIATEIDRQKKAD